MEIKINKKELIALITDFSIIMNTTIAVYDLNKKIIFAYPPSDKMNPFCKEIRSHKKLDEKCIECDDFGFEKCNKTEKTIIYRCHMQLLEIVSPIFFNNVAMFYIKIGQIRDIKNTAKLFPLLKEISESYNLNIDLLLNLFEKTSYFDSSKINSIIHIIEIVINHIILNNIINIKRNSLAASLETYIKNNLEKTLSSDILCQKFNISRSSLYSISKESFGKGISEYITSCRVEAAKKLLIESSYSITEIAEKSGYHDVNYFIRTFKQHTNLTPKQYQKLKNLGWEPPSPVVSY